MGVPCAGRSRLYARSMPVVGRLSTGVSMLACGGTCVLFDIMQTYFCWGQTLANGRDTGYSTVKTNVHAD